MVVAVVLPSFALVAATVAAALSVAAYRRRDRPGASALVVLTASAAVWTSSYAAALVTFDPGARQALETLVYLGRGSLPVAWILFAASYAGISDRFSVGHAAALVVFPAVVFLLTATAPLHDLLWTDYRVVGTAVAGVQYDPGPLFYVHVAYSYVLIGVGTMVILRALAADGQLVSVEGGAVAGGAGIALVASLLWLFDLTPVPGVDPTPMVMSVSCALFAVVLFRFDLFGRSPAPRVIGRRVALEGFSDAVLITDAENRVVDANTSARERLIGDPVGRPVAGVLGVERALDPGRHELELPTREGRRRYSVSVSPVRNRLDHTLGYTHVLRDVTRREHREQRLAVLSRVLRHNLRNDVNVIRGNAASATGATPADEQAIAAVERSADRLAGLSRKAGTVERVVAAEPTTDDPTSVGDVFDDAVDRVAESYPGVGFEVDIAPGPQACVDRELLFAVAENVVENAAKHGDSWVVVTVARDEGSETVTATVDDDGDGLPDLERETLLADTEGPLRHSAGLGLWVVRWGVDILGGTLSVDTQDASGTRVSVRLPVAPTADGDTRRDDEWADGGDA
ncbi:histidine kinase N-terminal 7TM domain-containing protein [Halobaculum marinum]|uniref:histidine kinase n=1 Tax=Halobaculum marinum TaxID=3031996 RepID=A0ABD5WW26_9EURY|nr:histidine kinase N-terminal 7TM domain-containing protein [Halobaculum sp. DT55]